jgi:hypothetical protein
VAGEGRDRGLPRSSLIARKQARDVAQVTILKLNLKIADFPAVVAMRNGATETGDANYQIANCISGSEGKSNCLNPKSGPEF